MTQVHEGPAFSLPQEDRRDNELDTGFRVLTDYIVQTDTRILRLDILRSGVQFNVGIQVSETEHPNLLVMPKRLNGCSVRANGQELIGALRGLADRLEQQVKDDAEKSKP